MLFRSEEEKKATISGYFPLFHYDPRTKTFTLDSKADFDKYEEFLNGEDRYKMLKSVNKKHHKELINENKKQAMERYQYYEMLDKMSKTSTSEEDEKRLQK